VALAQVLGLQRDFAGARRELDQALTLKPSDAWAHDAKAFLLVVTEGLTPTAIAEGRLAQRLDPLEAGHSHNLGMMLLSRGATTEAVQYFNQSIALEPRTESSYSALGVALAILGRHAEAEAQIRKALVISPTALDVLTDQAYVAVLAGKPQEARTILTQLQGQIGGERGALYIATVHAMLGELDASFEWLDRVSWDQGALLNLRVDLRLESIRSDPRYPQLLKKVALM
jgi:Flp pilus assembly protein TadD